MTPIIHAHPVNASSVDQARKATLSLDQADDLASLLNLLADPVRLRVLFIDDD